MKQGLVSNNVTNQLNQGANAFIAKGPNQGSFANEMQKLNDANQFIQQNNDDPNFSSKQEALSPDQEFAKFQNVLSKALANKGLDFDSLTPELKEKLALMQDAVKQEVIKRQGQEESAKSAEDLQNKFSSSESTTANVGQENQKQITEAVRESSMANQEQVNDQGDERKKQLANWEDLAPRVTEDPKNRAVRIDIPGLPEIETVIVRMQGSKIAIQTVGEGKIMNKLQSREKELVNKLSAHNISLDSLKTFDSQALKKGKV